MPWVPRGIREGVVTSRYPREPDGYGSGFRGSLNVSGDAADVDALDAVVDACPTKAIAVRNSIVELDRGACILCGRCVAMLPDVFEFSSGVETSSTTRSGLVIPARDDTEESVAAVRDALAQRVKVLRRSVHVRHVDAGSDGSEEWEIAALTNPIYDVQRLGIFFTASPRHADVLLVTGVGAAGMIEPLRRTLDVMPSPKVVIAAGVDAIGGGIIGEGYASCGGIGSSIPVDVFVPGSPPSPFGLLHGILMAVNLLSPLKSTSARTSGIGGNGARGEGP
jgi:Ni,Fe-hydrogenase III small subunit/ferredoxin